MHLLADQDDHHGKFPLHLLFTLEEDAIWGTELLEGMYTLSLSNTYTEELLITQIHMFLYQVHTHFFFMNHQSPE